MARRRTQLAAVPNLEEELDRLYALPLEEFTAARNDLAARLRKSGQADASASVKALAKPSVVAWAINQAVRADRAAADRLLATGEELRKAQAEAIGGGGSDALRDAQRAERQAARGFAAAAEAALEGAGRPPSMQVRDRIATTLRAAALDEDARALLAAGRLEQEVAGGGFEALAGMAAAAPARAAPKRASSGGRRERVAEARRALQAARREAREEARRAAAAERDAGRAEAAAEAARRDAEAARERADAAERAVADAEAALRAAER
jgi:hypothetical protein